MNLFLIFKILECLFYRHKTSVHFYTQSKNVRFKVNSTDNYHLAKKKAKFSHNHFYFHAFSFQHIFIPTHFHLPPFTFPSIFISTHIYFFMHSHFHAFSFSRIFIFTHFIYECIYQCDKQG